jgi:site-specific DNA recombinase
MKNPSLPSTPQAVIYARVSSKEQEKEGFSIPAQLRLLHEYARSANLNVVREVVDIETAKRTGRQNFEAMLTFFRRTRSCKVLLVEKTDRLYRNLKDWVSIDDLDLEIHFVKENVALSPGSRSAEKFMHGIKVLMAKNYIDNLSEETQKGMREKAEQGIYPSWGPIGYRNIDGPNGKRLIEPDPDFAPLVTRLFETYASGSHSLKELTHLARGWGLTFRSGTQMSKSAVHRILRNPIYIGRFRWAGIEYPGVHQPIVSGQLFESVQQRLEGRSAIGPHPFKHDFAFSGLVSCGHCGCSFVGEIKKGRYVYYHCTGYKRKCPEPYTREEVLAERFAGLLKGLALDADVVEWVAAALRGSHADEKHEREEAVARLQANYDQIQTRLDAMYLDKLDGRIDAPFFDRKSADWRREQDGILRNIQVHQDADQSYIEDGIQLLELASDAHELFLEQEPREKRRLLAFMVSSASWKEGELSVNLRQPFNLIRDGIAAATAAERSATNDGGSRTGRVLALSNSPKRPISNSEAVGLRPSQGKMANWLRSRDSNPKPCG